MQKLRLIFDDFFVVWKKTHKGELAYLLSWSNWLESEDLWYDNFSLKTWKYRVKVPGFSKTIMVYRGFLFSLELLKKM